MMHPQNIAELKRSLERRINDPPDNTVTWDHLERLDEARNYDAASSYNFLYAELMAIKHAVARGRVVTIETRPLITLGSVDVFMEWALSRYPAFVEPVCHDLYLDPVDVVWGGDR